MDTTADGRFAPLAALILSRKSSIGFVVNADQVADALGLDDEWVDGVMVGVGVE